MNGLTAEQAKIQIQFIESQVLDLSERQKLENWKLGAVENRIRKKAQIHAFFDSKERYKIKSKDKKIKKIN